MYFEKDYILRVIEMIGQFLSRLKEKTLLADQLAELDQLCREHVGLTLEAGRTLSEDTLHDLLDHQAVFILSEVLYIDSAMIDWTDRDQADESAMKSLRLLASLYEEDELAELRSQRLKELSTRLREYMSAADYLDCARFFLNGGFYSDTEDMVFLAVENASDGEKEYYRTHGLSLLYNMRVLPDDTLLPGGMSRAEINESIVDLQAVGMEGAVQ